MLDGLASITRSPAQKPACKDLGRNGQSTTITPKATYTPVSNRAGSRSQKKPSITNILLRTVSRGATLV
ncbi:ATP-dependent nuclease subunit B [Lactobacillus sp. DS1_6]|nr:ATP-dependent nuclease subunit B [Lacticaseibacillus paracasei]PTS47395.1 ATP-dependent nuclease subunit B [Lactobacillus sp. DS1_6]PTS53450.1 ATP-dependent nuclease subunit B [Lactobacillus sp. DS2_6]PTV42000.1 ATP-dependent nuclease subunit B [Lactobacillus sp. DS13_6]QPI89711.1 ATP-dependent nuclease subunit B [Lacticaseibacillus paracasei subsp. tolerans]